MRKYDTLKDTFVLVALFRWNQWALHVSSVINNKQEKKSDISLSKFVVTTSLSTSSILDSLLGLKLV